MARLIEIVEVAGDVAATRSRRGKVARLAELLARLRDDELAVTVGFLTGEPRQGRTGIGWGTLAALDVAHAASPSLSVAEVDDALQALTSLAGPGSRQRRHQRLTDLYGRATREEAAFLTALLLGEMRQGALEGVLVQAIAAAWELDESVVRRALMFTGDLGAVARAAAEGGERALRGYRLQLFRPLQPMLASTAASVDDALGAPPVLVEAKLDGARIQVHRRGEDVRVYTRALRDVTADSPRVVSVVRALAVHELVLDGEVLALGADGRPEAFQDSMRRGAALRPFFFDLLHVDGVDLLDEPLRRRRAALEVVVPTEHRVSEIVAEDAAAVAAALAEALERGHEGVMVKDPDAPYEAGRRGASWRKLKPVHTLDLVVLAVEWGSGRRRGLLSNLHLGARDATPDSADAGGSGFVMLGKTFKGLTDELLAWQTRELLARETRREGNVVHVRPELVVEVAFDGVQTSPRYPGGVALRFARVRRYRDDKAPAEADTIDTVRAMLPYPTTSR